MGRTPPRLRWAAASALAVIAADAWACGFSAPQFEAGVEHQHWAEFEDGRRIVREQGSLPRIGAGVVVRCAAVELDLAASATHGSRRYDGLTNLGRRVTTTTDWREHELALAAWPWQLPLGLRLSGREAQRKLRSTGSARGYLEQHRAAELAVGLRHAAALPPAGWRWELQAWLGGHAGGRLHVDLPQAEPATLRTGRAVQLEARLRIARMAAGRSGPHAELRMLWRDTAAGPASPLWQDGRLVGSAMQPRTTQSSLGLAIGHRW